MDKDSTITSLFLKVLRNNHIDLHNHIIEKYEQWSLTSPLATEDMNCQEYDPARVKEIVKSVHQAARREVPTKPEYNAASHQPTTEPTTHQRPSRPPPLMAHTGIPTIPPKTLSINLAAAQGPTKERHEQWILPPPTDLHPCTTGEACVACSLKHKVEDCPFIFHGKHRDNGTMELYFPVFYKLDDKDITAYLVHLTTHGFLKTATQEEVDDIVKAISKKRRSFQYRQEDPDRDNYRRTKAKYGDYPNPPEVHRPRYNGGYSNRQERYDNGKRNVDNRPSWRDRTDKPNTN
jgi:hypothetical protein